MFFRKAPGAPVSNRSLLTLMAAFVFMATLKISAVATNSKWGVDMMACSFILVFLLGLLFFGGHKEKDPFVKAEEAEKKREQEAKKARQKIEEDKLRKNILD